MRAATIVAAAAVAASAALLAAAGPTAADARIGTSVKDRAPVGVAASFPASVGRLVCFSEVTGGAGTIAHVWYHGDAEVRRIELAVKGPRWRTWSVKNIPPAMTGDWRVEVRDASGAVLATARFTVR